MLCVYFSVLSAFLLIIVLASNFLPSDLTFFYTESINTHPLPPVTGGGRVTYYNKRATGSHLFTTSGVELSTTCY
jgi:hypothetical protein